MGEDHSHGFKNILIADNETIGDMVLVDGEGDFAGHRGDDGITDGACRWVISNPLAFIKGAFEIIKAFWLSGIDFNIGFMVM